MVATFSRSTDHSALLSRIPHSFSFRYSCALIENLYFNCFLIRFLIHLAATISGRMETKVLCCLCNDRQYLCADACASVCVCVWVCDCGNPFSSLRHFLSGCGHIANKQKKAKQKKKKTTTFVINYDVVY